MSVRHALLALLEREPMHGYQLRAAYEEATGGTWPLNIGQVYTTLSRLERDGLVLALPESQVGQRPYEITNEGRVELGRWFDTPVGEGGQPRDELSVKLALAVNTPGVDVAGIVQQQRVASLRRLQEYTRLKARADVDADLPWLLVLNAMMFQAEATVRWLDHCEAFLLRRAANPRPLPKTAPVDDAAGEQMRVQS